MPSSNSGHHLYSDVVKYKGKFISRRTVETISILFFESHDNNASTIAGVVDLPEPIVQIQIDKLIRMKKKIKDGRK